MTEALVCAIVAVVVVMVIRIVVAVVVVAVAASMLAPQVLRLRVFTLPETNMETQKGPYKDYSPLKGGLYGCPC